MNECEKIDNVLLKLEYELLGSSLCINLTLSTRHSPFVLKRQGERKWVAREREAENEREHLSFDWS